MAQSSGRLSPRQKMINLMYIVLTAMLALNVSSDVLDGFTQVEDGLARSNENVSQRNQAIYSQLQAFNDQNPEKGGPWLEKATEVRREADEMYMSVDSVKWAIVRAADGENADINNIQSRDDLESASVTMLNPTTRRGEKLRLRIDSFRDYITSIVTDSMKKASILSALSTEPFQREGLGADVKWEDSKFESQPVVAAITLLTKLQNDIRYAEGEALTTILNNVDAGDVRVNELNAFVIPQSRFVMRGGRYSANIVLAAVDTTARPEIFIGERKLENTGGLYEVSTGSTGTFDYSGYLQVQHGDGTTTRHPFSSSYVVMEPSATVSATMMNVLYAGIDNPISISVPGVPQSNVTASMTNGTLTKSGDKYIARPGKVGSEAVITVTATIDGRPQTVNTTSFRVRKLPDPVAFISMKDDKGTPIRYKGGKPITKAALMASDGLDAAIDDEMLNIDFKVLGFETVFFDSMGNAMPEVSQGASFSQRQKDTFRRLSRGKRFYISRVRAIGPDGVERTLAPVEVIVN